MERRAAYHGGTSSSSTPPRKCAAISQPIRTLAASFALTALAALVTSGGALVPGSVASASEATPQPIVVKSTPISIATPPPSGNIPHIPPHLSLGPAPFDIIVDLKFPAPTPAPTAAGTPNPNPTFVEAPRYNVGGTCANLSVVLAKLVATEGQPGQAQAAITSPLGTITPVSATGLGLACVATFSSVPRNFQLLVGTRYKGQPIANSPVGGWSNPFTVGTADPQNPTTHHQFRELSIAVPAQ